MFHCSCLVFHSSRLADVERLPAMKISVDDKAVDFSGVRKEKWEKHAFPTQRASYYYSYYDCFYYCSLVLIFFIALFS